MPFKKGQSGNPGGRKKRDWTWSGLLEKVGEEVEPKSGQKFKELVSRRIWIEAVNGNMIAIKEITNRMDGMPAQTNILAGDGVSPLTIRIVDDKPYDTNRVEHKELPPTGTDIRITGEVQNSTEGETVRTDKGSSK